MKNFLISLVTGLMAGLAGAFLFVHYVYTPPNTQVRGRPAPPNQPFNTFKVDRQEPVRTLNGEADFAEASARSTPSVVFIKTLSNTNYGRVSWFELFFEGRSSQQQVSTGSGVIYSKDGYIITNNHVIDNANRIQVIHNKRAYEASVIGTDPGTDIAVLKVEENNLPNIELGSSRNLKVGEWVLAVGNPFNLTSTVTAGIVSAKGRDINILKSDIPIESFIQTDAAINPGNSGGALVNREGKLVGINTAILSRTGSYAGYGFAVPVDVVRKVTDDIIEYGEVQKAILGADILDITPEIADRLNISNRDGVVVNAVRKNGAAARINLQPGDIITAVGGEPVNSKSEFDEIIGYYSPGDKVTLSFSRNNKPQQEKVLLTNQLGTTSIITREVYESEHLGAVFETLPEDEQEILGIPNGVRIAKINRGFMQRLGIQEGFIVTAINKNSVKTPRELESLLKGMKGKVVIEGINNRGVKGYYSYYF
jgi:serine protease Do